MPRCDGDDLVELRLVPGEVEHGARSFWGVALAPEILRQLPADLDPGRAGDSVAHDLVEGHHAEHTDEGAVSLALYRQQAEAVIAEALPGPLDAGFGVGIAACGRVEAPDMRVADDVGPETFVGLAPLAQHQPVRLQPHLTKSSSVKPWR